MQKTCNDYLTASQLESGFGNGGVNIYDIFADVCGADREVAVVRQFARVLGTAKASAGSKDIASTASLAAAVSLPTPGRSSSLNLLPSPICVRPGNDVMSVAIGSKDVVATAGRASVANLCMFREW